MTLFPGFGLLWVDMIFIGNQTACWARTPNEPFDYALAQRFDAFEWFPDKKPGAGWDESDLNAGARRNIREAARAARIRLSVHARWQANPLAADSYPLLWKDLELAVDLGAALLNVHLFHEQGLAAFVEALLPLVRRSAGAGLQLAIENTPHHSPEEFNELFALLRKVDSLQVSHVGMCLDLGHANLCAATRNDFIAFCDRLDPQVPLIHLHLHENWGDADTHLPLFTGPAAADSSGIRSFLSRLRQRHFDGAIILEQWPQPPSLLNQARDRLMDLWQALGNAEGEEKTEPSSSGSFSSDSLRRSPFENQDKNPDQGADEKGHSGGGAGLESKDSQPMEARVGDFAAEIVAGNQRCRSWREKLEFARGLLAGKERPLTPEELLDLAIFLRFLGTGEIPCSEDGRHFRPAHHARIAAAMQERLAGLTTPENAWIVRKIYPWLPSSAPDFQRPEPLTRIRDIAHRNDIDHAFKREIKTTLQNKLHRCAGPEDLATSAALLDRITAPGANFPPAFVEQFRIFHEELKEFFNARSVEDRLQALLPSSEPGQAELIRAFQQEPRAGETGGVLARRLKKLESLTALRESLLGTAARSPGLQQQELILADIGLEDFAFVLLSEICNELETPKAKLSGLVDALVFAVKNVALSEVEPQECAAVAAELRAWGKISESSTRDELLRLKATALRGRRLAEDFTTRAVALFTHRVETLGRALAVPAHAIRVFAESDVRSHNVFQLSKLVTNFLRRLRRRLGLPGWDVVVSGRAVGRAIAAKALEDLHRQVDQQSGPWIVLLDSVAGDEEIPPNVAGIVLAHEIPHLSHLAVRARQAGIVFAACEEPPEFERLRSSEGQTLAFQAQPDNVSWQRAAQPGGDSRAGDRPSPQIIAAKLHPDSPWMPLDTAVAQTSGGKASAARRLAELSRQTESGFRTPAGFVVPFGVMESALQSSPEAEREYARLIKVLNDAPAPAANRNNGSDCQDQVAATTQRLRALIQQLEVPAAIVAEAVRRFTTGTRLIVRSSANCEDVEGLAGAGLYDSVINVTPLELPSAIRTVWSSLWTERAALSRHGAGIPHEQAHMAVLIQDLVAPDFSFVLHTVNPLSSNADELYAEIALGLGETLVSAATRGNPYRLVCRKQSGAVTTVAFANFSQTSLADAKGGLRRTIVDYSRVSLSLDAAARNHLGQRLTAIGCFVETAMRMPQDIEGAIVGDEVFLVQSRPQTGLGRQLDYGALRLTGQANKGNK